MGPPLRSHIYIYITSYSCSYIYIADIALGYAGSNIQLHNTAEQINIPLLSILAMLWSLLSDKSSDYIWVAATHCIGFSDVVTFIMILNQCGRRSMIITECCHLTITAPPASILGV